MTTDPTNPTALSCTDIKALLSAIVDAELDAARRHEVERHLVECGSCRDLVSQAEAIDAMLATEAEAMAAGAMISPGFEAAVLNRTVFAPDHATRSRRWTLWGGWIAAAAALGLAMTIWIVDRRSLFIPTDPSRRERVQHLVEAPPIDATLALEHSTRDQNLIVATINPDESRVHLRVTSSDDGAPIVAKRDDSEVGAAATLMLVNDNLATFMGPDRELADDDLATVDAAARMLRLLREADVTAFSDVEQVRRLTVADNLLERLARLKPRLDSSDLPAVFAAESMLWRVVNGPISLDDLRDLRDAATDADLCPQLDGIYVRGNPRGML